MNHFVGAGAFGGLPPGLVCSRAPFLLSSPAFLSLLGNRRQGRGTSAAGGEPRLLTLATARAVTPPISPPPSQKNPKIPQKNPTQTKKHRLTVSESLGLQSMPVTHLAFVEKKQNQKNPKTAFNCSCARLTLSECWDFSARLFPHSFVS